MNWNEWQWSWVNKKTTMNKKELSKTLREGNILNFNGTHSIIHLPGIYGMYNGLLEYAEPIRLTNKILLKCGFVKDELPSYSISISTNRFDFKVLSFHSEYLFLRQGPIKQDRSLDQITTLWNYDVNPEFFTLDRLQNLFYYLTGKDLVYK